jgi:hypothetical protein
MVSVLLSKPLTCSSVNLSDAEEASVSVPGELLSVDFRRHSQLRRSIPTSLYSLRSVASSWTSCSWSQLETRKKGT